MKTVKNNPIFVKAMMNGILGWVLMALFTSAMHTDVTLVQACAALPVICSGIAAGIGSYIGYLRQENRKNIQ